MSTPVESMPITLDYLKGKRRAEKALGFLTDIGPRLLSCDTTQQLAQMTADHLLRLNLDLCLIDLRPRAGTSVTVVSQALDLDQVVPGAAGVVDRCRHEAARLAAERTAETGPLDRSDSVFDAGGNKVLVQQFALHHADFGTGAVSAVRIRANAAEFTSADLLLLRDVSARLLACVRRLPD